MIARILLKMIDAKAAAAAMRERDQARAERDLLQESRDHWSGRHSEVTRDLDAARAERDGDRTVIASLESSNDALTSALHSAATARDAAQKRVAELERGEQFFEDALRKELKAGEDEATVNAAARVMARVAELTEELALERAGRIGKVQAIRAALTALRKRLFDEGTRAQVDALNCCGPGCEHCHRGMGVADGCSMALEALDAILASTEGPQHAEVEASVKASSVAYYVASIREWIAKRVAEGKVDNLPPLAANVDELARLVRDASPTPPPEAR